MSTRLSRRKISSYIADQLVAGSDAKTIVNSLAAFLISTRRTSETDLILRDVDYQLSERGVVLASVVSAYALSDAIKQAIIDTITRHTTAKTIELQQFIDSTVLGGMRIDVPGRRLDATIKRRLNLLTINDKN